MHELATKIKTRLEKLDTDIELSYEKIFDILCQEYHLNSSYLEQALSCKCPFALIGFINELELPEISDCSDMIKTLNTHS
jgi:hypothetical protein